MTLNTIVKKLLKNNFKQYLLLSFCIFITVSFITSVGILITGDTIKGILVSGGSAMQLSSTCYGLLIIGSVVFIGYVFTLFLKFKSKELGIFMCLGITKKNVAKIIKKEIFMIVPAAIILGLIFSYPLSLSVWSLFSKFIKTTTETEFQVGMFGYVIGIIYALIIVILLVIMLNKYLKKMDLISILKSEETVETVREFKPYTSIVGVLLIPIGFLVMDMFMRMDGILSLLGVPSLAISAFGIYLICARLPFYGVSKKSKNPKKYYQNIVYYNLIKLKGKQYISAIFVTTIILGVSTFSLIYILSQIMMTDKLLSSKTAEYTISHISDIDVVDELEILEIANEHNVDIKEFIEFESIVLVEDLYADYLEGGYEKYNNTIEIISEKTYESLTSEKIDVKEDSFVGLYAEKGGHGFYPEENKVLTNTTNKESKEFKFQENKVLNMIDGTISGVFYILDNDTYKNFDSISESDKKMINKIFFTENWENEYTFAEDIRANIINAYSDTEGEHTWCEHIRDELTGEECSFEAEDLHVTLEEGNAEMSRWWKYAPKFKVLMKNEMVYDYAVYLLLFIFIAILGFIASGIILYVKSLSNIWNDKKVYQNISYLGAKKEYIISCVTKLQRILFLIPTLAGSLAAFSMLSIIGMVGGEAAGQSMILFSIPPIIIIFIIQYISYYISKRKILNTVLDFKN